MRTAIFSFALISFSFFLFANQASAQTPSNVVFDQNKKAGLELVQPTEQLILFNPREMNPEQLAAAVLKIQDDIKTTNDEIRVLSGCGSCRDGIPALKVRNEQNQALLDYISRLPQMKSTATAGKN